MDKELFLVPYAHLDTQWRWEYPTTIKKYIKNTMTKNFKLFKKYPHYVFNFPGAVRYSMMKEYYPDKFELVKKYIKEGRWIPAAGCIDETDAIVPCVESLVRNILYGRKWQEREFGKTNRDYMLPDCFGFTANFPTVLNHMDITGFSTQKLTWNSANGVPFQQGIWEGPDGSKLLCAFNPGNYTGRIYKPLEKCEERLKKVDSFGESNGIYKSLQYYGVGDVGGAPQVLSVYNVEKASINGIGYTITQGAADTFYDSLSKEIDKLDTYSGDLLLIQHSAGSLTSQAIMKRLNRECERLAFAAEYIALVAESVAGIKYPKDRIEKNWFKIIANQMHDILPGTCTPEAYKYSINDEILAIKEWRKIIDESIEAISPYIKGGEVLVFNPSDTPRKTSCEIAIPGMDYYKRVSLEDEKGNVYPVSINNRATMVFEPYLEAFEIKRFKFVPREKTKTNLIFSVHDGITMQNDNISISINHDGEICSIKDKIKNKELLRSPLAYHLLTEKPIKYPAWNMYWKDRQKEPDVILTKGESSIVEDTSFRKKISIVTKYNKSTFTKIISLTPDSKFIEFEENIDWYEKGKSLKLALDLNYDTPKFYTNLETCVVEKGVNHEKQYEVPSRYYLKMKQGEEGVALIENCKYGYDIPKSNMLRLTLLYTPRGRITAFFYDQYTLDHGMHNIKYAIYPFNKDDVDQVAKSFNNPNQIYHVKSDFVAEKETKLFELDYSKIGVLAVKKSEDNNGYIIRMYNRTEDILNTKIKFYSKIKSVQIVNGYEETQKELEIKDDSVDISIIRNGIISIKVENIIEVKEQSQKCLDLEYDSNVLGNIIPAELVQDTIEAGDVSFNLCKKTNNALSCVGQTINLDKNYNKISVLVFAKKDTTFSATLDGNKVFKQISSSFGFVGQADTRKWLFKPLSVLLNTRGYLWINPCIGIKKGYVKEDKIAFYTSHRNDIKSGQYKHVYVYQLDFENKGTNLVLDSNEDIKVLAITQYHSKSKASNIAVKTDIYDI